MVIKNGLIEYIGDEPERRIPEILENGQQNEVVDLNGKSVFAAFIDGHMHLLQFGASLVKIGLDDCKDLDEIRMIIRKAARDMPNAKRILCRGWRQASTNRMALASMIDDIDPRPIYIDADDLHSTWCSSPALMEMGIDRNTPDPVGGTIERDADGNPTGLIGEGAVITIVWPFLIGAMSRDEKLECMLTAIREYHASGYTGVVEMAMDAGSWELLEHLHRKGQLTLHLAAHWLITPTTDDAENLAQVQEAIDLHAKYNLQNSPSFRIAGIKLICDGVIDSCTAALSKPYLVSPYGTGDCMWKPPHIDKVVAKADATGLQVALHAIGDAAVHMAVNSLQVLKTQGRRHRIEHLELTHPDDAKRLGKLGITASVQPVHSDPTILKAWPELIGEERCEWAFAHHTFHEHGAQLAIGTDSPTAPHLPFPNMYVANTRHSSRDLKDHSRVNKIPGLDLDLVWSAATWGSAYSCFAENMIGSLEVGKQADLIVVDGLSKRLDAPSLMHAKIDQTRVGGKVVYERLPLNT